MAVNQRNANIKRLMAELLVKASTKEFEVDTRLQWQLQQVFSTTSWGFREILLVIGIAKLLDLSYLPTTQLYKCNPRALYEGPIREILQEAGIPHRKSGPLNIAKATAGINEAWAAQRRPREVAMAAVELAHYIEKSSGDQVRNFLAALLSMLLGEAARVQSLGIEVPAESDINYLSHLCFMLIDNVPASGNTPEYIVGLLLESYHDELNSKVQVLGYTKGASTTSTTSKKPADIIEQSPNGDVLAAYEVTMKPFDKQRIDDSEDAVSKYNDLTGQNISEVNVICRNEDVHPDATRYSSTAFHLGTLEFSGIVYQFYEIHHWIAAALGRLTPSNRAKFYQHLNKYIANPNTSELVKECWKQLHEGSG